jgi:hypothetical protein
MNHTCFPKEDHIPDRACRENQVKKGDRVECLELYAFHLKQYSWKRTNGFDFTFTQSVSIPASSVSYLVERLRCNVLKATEIYRFLWTPNHVAIPRLTSF